MNQTIIIITACISLFVTAILGKILIPILRKLKFGQVILDIGPNWHKNKQGTPTMGGLSFAGGIILAIIAGCAMLVSTDGWLEKNQSQLYKVVGVLTLAIGFGAIGFIDDYVKVVKKQNLGLTAKQKLVLQVLVAVTYLVLNVMSGDGNTIFVIPFLGQIDFGMFYYVVAVFIIIAIVNAVNLTDGVDGLAATVTFFVAVGFMIIASMLSNPVAVVIATALAGGCVGFLFWNFYPAKMFMGDTGSMFLGGMVVGLGFNVGFPFILPIIGVIYLMETLSVVIQVISFKTTGKRVFKMSPIHHHFEMSGYTEIKIVAMFSVITIIGAALSILFINSL